MCSNLIIPLIVHYLNRFKKQTKSFLIDYYFDPLFDICGKGVNLKEKIFRFNRKFTFLYNKQPRQKYLFCTCFLIGYRGINILLCKTFEVPYRKQKNNYYSLRYFGSFINFVYRRYNNNQILKSQNPKF